MLTRGHLFIIQADLTRVAADAFLVPCDTDGRVAGTWRPFLEPGAASQAKNDWFKPRRVNHDGEFPHLPDTTPEDSDHPDQVTGLRVLVDTVRPDSIEGMVQYSLEAVRFAAKHARHHDKRVIPLVALPILGVGQGNFPGRRMEVLRLLVQGLLEFVATEPIDVVLVLRRPADLAAAQWVRGSLTDQGLTGWSELDPDLRDLADDLGSRAADGGLSVFAGAGVSKPIGFPDWAELMASLLKNEKLPTDANFPELAQQLDQNELTDTLVRRFSTPKYAIGHSLLANLRTHAMVTTNYDPCLENASEAVREIRVMARELSAGREPWLLKLHGDIALPKTFVLTTEQYQRLDHDHRALRGVVQTLMLTSHLLFVGFGFADEDFLAMAEAVQKIRDLAVDPAGQSSIGTAIELVAKPRKRTYRELDYRAISPEGSNVSEAARLLEVLLDRVAWRSQIEGDVRASFLLDPDYQSGATPADEELAEALRHVRKVVERATTSAGRQAVLNLTERLGYREARLP